MRGVRGLRAQGPHFKGHDFCWASSWSRSNAKRKKPTGTRYNIFFNGKGYRDTWKYKKSGDDATCSEFPESSVDIYLLAISGERPSVAFGQEDAFCLP